MITFVRELRSNKSLLIDKIISAVRVISMYIIRFSSSKTTTICINRRIHFYWAITIEIIYITRFFNITSNISLTYRLYIY